jgi:5-methyltetrahydrofolate--homocysteine methyltransferase
MDDYEEIREDHYAGLEDKRTVSLEIAKKKKHVIDFSKVAKAPVQGCGSKSIEYEIKDLIPFIDWTPFFAVFELHGRYPNRGYPNIFKDDLVGAEALKLYEEAKQMLDDICSGKFPLKARAVVGIYPARSNGEDVLIWEKEEDGK